MAKDKTYSYALDAPGQSRERLTVARRTVRQADVEAISKAAMKGGGTWTLLRHTQSGNALIVAQRRSHGAIQSI